MAPFVLVGRARIPRVRDAVVDDLLDVFANDVDMVLLTLWEFDLAWERGELCTLYFGGRDADGACIATGTAPIAGTA